MFNAPAKSPLTAIVMASLAAIGASVCCVVPLVLVLLGVSGAWIVNLTALDAWRPWFSVATLAWRSWSFGSLCARARGCRTGGACADPGVLRRGQRWLWVATVVIELLLLFPYYIAWLL